MFREYPFAKYNIDYSPSELKQYENPKSAIEQITSKFVIKETEVSQFEKMLGQESKTMQFIGGYQSSH